MSPNTNLGAAGAGAQPVKPAAESISRALWRCFAMASTNAGSARCRLRVVEQQQARVGFARRQRRRHAGVLDELAPGAEGRIGLQWRYATHVNSAA